MTTPQQYMTRALALARRAAGFTSPNPMVGAVIVKNGKIIGEGYHRAAGQPHAEIEALRMAGEDARGATMYVTLEPCNHHGKTPPCTEAIIEAGIAAVHYAIPDPNPHVSGGGHQRLANAGITVSVGLGAPEARTQNRFFLHAVTSGKPYVIAKFAMSLDGKIATRTGDSQWISGAAAREAGHRLRQLCDVIVVGANTVIADDPRLTVRLPDVTPAHPLRVVLDSRGRVPLSAKLFSPNLPGKTIVATTKQMPADHRRQLNALPIETIILPQNRAGHVSPAALLDELGQRGYNSLQIEGGGTVLGAFFDAGLVDEVWAFIAPLVIGGSEAPTAVGGLGVARLSAALKLHHTTVTRMGDDFLLRGYTAAETVSP